MATDTTNFQSDAAETVTTVHEGDIEQIHLTQAASAPVQVQVPAGENVVRVQVTPGETIQLPFPIDAVVARLGENGNLAVKVGDITVILVGYGDATAQEEVILIGTDSRPMDVAAVLASTDPNLDIQTAAGPAAGDQGAGPDNNGGLFAPFDPNSGIGGLNAVGGLDPTALNYNLIQRQNILYEPEDVVVEAGTAPEITTINIAVNEDDLSSERGETGPSDFQAAAVASNCDLPAQYDGNDEFDGSDSDLPGGLPDLSKEQTDVIASINVDYGADLPSNPAMAFNLLGLDNVPTSNGEVLILTLSIDEQKILATRPSDGVSIFEVHLVSVTVNGSVVTYDVEFCLINRIDHPEAGVSPENQDSWPITVNFEVTDSTGTAGTGHFDVTVKDDVPFIGYPFQGDFLSIQQDGGELCISDANLDGPISLYGSFGPLNYGADGPWGAGESGEFKGDNAGQSPATLALQIVDPDGAVDGNGDPVIWADLTFDAHGDPVGTSSLKSGGETVLFKQVYDSNAGTLTIFGYLDDGLDNGNDWENAGNLVVRIAVNVNDASVDGQSGQNQIWVFQPLDHPDAGANGAETGPNDEFVFNLGLTIKDDDGDTATATASFCVNDDGPQIHSMGFRDLVILDETAGSQFGDTDLSGGVSQSLSVIPVSSLFTTQYGADGPGSTTYALTTFLGSSFGTAVDTGTPSGLFATSVPGTEIFLFQSGSLVAGRIGNDPAGTLAFTISIVGDNIQVQQWLALKHPTNDPQEPVLLHAVAVTATATDADGDTATATAPVRVDFWDDGPDAKNDTDSVENLQTTTGNVITGDGTTNDPAGDDVAGADGGAAVINASGSGSGGFQPADGATIIQGTFGKLVISANGDYTYTRDTSGPLINSDVFTYTLKDGDGDTDPATLTINIYDEGTELDLDPDGENDNDVAEQGLPTRTINAVIEPAGSGEIADGDGSNDSDTSEQAGGTMSFATPDGFGSLTIAGKDGPVVIANGVTIHGLHGDMVITAFDSLNGTLSYTYTLFDNVDHSGGAVTDDFAVVVTDSDGDSSTDTLSIDIVDDQPTANDDTDSVAEGESTAAGNVMTGAGTAGGTGGSGVDVEGADGAGVSEVSGQTTDSDGSDGFSVNGLYGTLVMDKFGNYTYTVGQNVIVPEGAQEVFTYTLKDGDTDTDPATLTIDVPPTDLAEGTLAVSGCIAEDNQPGQWSGDETELREALAISFTQDDDETVTGATIDIPTGWQLEVWNPGGPSQVALLSAGSGVDISAYIDDVLAGNLELRPVPPANTDVDGAFTLHVDIEDQSSSKTATLDQPFTVFVDAVADKPSNVTISVDDDGVIQKVQGQDTLVGEGDGHFVKDEEGNVAVTANFNDTDGSEGHIVVIDLVPGFGFDVDGNGTFETSGNDSFLYEGKTVNYSILNGDLTLTLDPTIASFNWDVDIEASGLGPNDNITAEGNFFVKAQVDENYLGVSGGGCGPNNTDLDPVNADFDNQSVTTAGVSAPNILNGSFITNTNVQKQVALVTFVDKNDPLMAFSQLLVRGSQGQQGAILTDAGFLIDGTHDFLVGVEATAGTKVIITDFSLEGVSIVDPGNAQVEVNDIPGGPDSTAIVQSIQPSTEGGTYQAFESSQDDATGSTAAMTDANAGAAGSAADYVFGGAGDDTITASNDGANILNGGDILNAANNGTDTITGGDDTDVLVFDPLDTLDGGAGFDIVRVDQGAIFNTMTAEGLTLPAGLTNATVDMRSSDISNVESILITEEANPNGAGTTIQLNAENVLDFTDGDNLLYVLGSAGDQLDLDNAGGYTAVVNGSFVDAARGMSFNIYDIKDGSNAVVGQLYVDQDVQVI